MIFTESNLTILTEVDLSNVIEQSNPQVHCVILSQFVTFCNLQKSFKIYKLNALTFLTKHDRAELDNLSHDLTEHEKLSFFFIRAYDIFVNS